jgi:hypothetical protein
MDGFATGLSTAITKDGQTTITANLPMATFRHTGVGNATARNNYAAAGQVQDSAFIWCGTAGGTKNALTLTPSPAITAYATGQRFIFKAGTTASDDAVTIAVSGLATKAGQVNDAAMSATVIIEANKYYEALYDGTAFQLTRLSDIVTKTGVDAALVSGTAGTDGNLAQWNADGDLVDGPDVLDEDDMVSDSATDVASQQSIKAYVDAEVAAIPGITLGTPQATTSGTAITFSSIPAGTKRITFSVSALSTNGGSSAIIIQIGDSGGVEPTGYLGSATAVAPTPATSTITTGFALTQGSEDAGVLNGVATLTLLNASTNLWAFSSTLGASAGGSSLTYVGAGSKALTGALDRVVLTTLNGTNTFDAGSVNIQYE